MSNGRVVRATAEFAAVGSGSDNRAYVDLETGKIYLVSSELELEEEVPDDLEESDRYLAVPGKNDLDLGRRLVERFLQERLPGDVEQVRAFFRHKGAYRRLKVLLADRGLLEQGYAFEQAETTAALRAWCQENVKRGEVAGSPQNKPPSCGASVALGFYVGAYIRHGAVFQREATDPDLQAALLEYRVMSEDTAAHFAALSHYLAYLENLAPQSQRQFQSYFAAEKALTLVRLATATHRLGQTEKSWQLLDTFAMHYPDKVHYDGAKDEEVLVQISGIDPSGTIPVNPGEAPKQARSSSLSGARSHRASSGVVEQP